MNVLAVCAVCLVLAPLVAFAQTDQTYTVQIDEHAIDVSYSIDADVLAMEIDSELNSLLVGIENTQNTTFEIHLPDELISAQDDVFVILVDWEEVQYDISKGDGITTLTMNIPEDSQEIEIIGTHVIPEFPLGVMMILGLVLVSTILVSRKFNLGGNGIQSV